MSKPWGRWRKLLWPFQKSWTLADSRGQASSIELFFLTFCTKFYLITSKFKHFIFKIQLCYKKLPYFDIFDQWCNFCIDLNAWPASPILNGTSCTWPSCCNAWGLLFRYWSRCLHRELFVKKIEIFYYILVKLKCF